MMPMQKTGRLVLCSLVLQGCSTVTAMAAQGQALEQPVLELVKTNKYAYEGDYQIGEFSGLWKRKAAGDGLAKNLADFDGHVRFTLRDPVLEGQLEITCNLREAALELLADGSHFPAYGCDFLINGETFPARFEVQQSAGNGLMLGEIALDRVILNLLQIQPQGEFPMFLFTLEGRRLGLVSFDETTTVRFYEEVSLAVRRAVMTTVLALDLLRKPA